MPAQWVLVVDDNLADARLAQKLLAPSGGPTVACEHARSAAEAYARLLPDGEGRAPGDPPSLILLDLSLPGTGGLEILEVLRADPGLRSLPTVILSSSLAPADVEAAYRLGATAYVRKPANLEEARRIFRGIADFWLGASLRWRTA